MLKYIYAYNLLHKIKKKTIIQLTKCKGVCVGSCSGSQAPRYRERGKEVGAGLQAVKSVATMCQEGGGRLQRMGYCHLTFQRIICSTFSYLLPREFVVAVNYFCFKL